MTPDRAAELTTRWVRWYTRALPAPVAERRICEIAADLHDHIAHEQERGTGDRRIAVSVLSRMIRGLAADASWRYHHRPGSGDLMKLVATVLVMIAAVVLGLFTMAYAQRDDAPGLGLIGLLLILGAIGFGTRSILRRRRAGRR